MAATIRCTLTPPTPYHRIMRLVILTLLVPLALIAPIGATEPQDQRVERDAAQIFDRVMSPYCPGRTLATCGSGAAEELRQEINGWMVELWDKAKSGNPVATPSSKACPMCDLGSLCRAAPYADPSVDWTLSTEDTAE